MSALSQLLLNQLKLMHVILQTEIPCNTKHEVFVEVNIDLHTESNQRAALIAKLDTGAQGTLLPLILYIMYHPMFPQNLAVGGLPKWELSVQYIQLMMVLSLCSVEHAGSHVNS